MNGKYFDITRDNELIASGTHFFCNACLVARPLDDQSPDQRYCQACFDVLKAEAELLSPKKKRPDWVPVLVAGEALPAVKERVTKLPTNGVVGGGVLLHAGGRPRKEGKVTRMTNWRRGQKEKQGVLC